MPVEGESGTMSKFAYYIDFLVRYLDPPVDELLQSDLNELRFYRNLNLKVLILNCSGIATARRTNKIGINEEKVKDLLRRAIWAKNEENPKKKIFHLVVGHYSPEYQLSYFIDHFPVLPGWKWGMSTMNKEVRYINHLVDTFIKSIKVEIKGIIDPNYYIEDIYNARKTFSHEFISLKQAMDAALQGKTCSSNSDSDLYFQWLMETVKSGNEFLFEKSKKPLIQSTVADINKNELYKKMKEYQVWIESDGKWNESISQLLFDINEKIYMGDKDKQRFSDFVKTMVYSEDNHKNSSYDLYLAGHIHAYSENDENHILVADKMFDDNKSDIRGYIIQIEDVEEKKSELKYTYKRLGFDA